MTLATLSIDLVAKLAKFEQGMDQAARIAEKRAKQIDRAMGSLKQAAGALGGAIGAAFAVQEFRAQVDLLDSLAKMSERTGVAVETLSALRYAGDLADVSLETLGGGLRSLANNMQANVKAFEVLGVKTRDANGNLRDVDAVLEDLADRFASMRDGAAKSALAADVLGAKYGPQMLTLLNQGKEGLRAQREEAERLGVIYRDDAAKAAAEFNDQITRLQKVSEGLKVQIASSMLPTLTELAAFYAHVAKDEGVAKGALILFGGGLAATLGVDEVGELQRRAEAQSNAIALIVKQIERFEPLAQRGVRGARERVEQLRAQLQTMQAAAAQTSTALKSLADAQDQALKPASPTKAKTDPADPEELERKRREAERKAKEAQQAMQRAEKAYDELIKRITDRTAAAQVELETGRQLSAEQQFALDVVGRLADKELQLSDAQKQAVTAALEKSLAIQDQARNQRELLELQKAAQSLAERDMEALAAEAESRAQMNEQLRLAIEEMGLTAQQVDALRIKRLEHALAIEEEALAMARNAEASQQEIQLRERSIRLLQEQVGLRKKEAAEAGKQFDAMTVFADQAARNIQDSLGSSVRSLLEGDFDSIEDHFKNMLKNMAAQAISANLAQLIIGNFGATGQVGGLLGSLFGSMGGATANADGAAFSRYGRVTAFANGGVFNGPTAFSYAGGKLGVMGEAGPEAVMPLKRGRNGKLGVVAEGGQPVIINQTFHFGEGVNRAELAQWAEGIKRSTMSAIYQSRNRAGAFSQ